MKKPISIVVKVILAAIATVMLFAATACNTGVYQDGELPEGYEPEIAGKLKVTCRADVFPNPSAQKSVNSWINYFRGAHPNVSVEVNFGASDYAALISSKTIGDVYWLSDADVYNYAVTQEALMPLDSYIEAYGIDTAELYGGIMALCEAEGKYYFAGYSCGNVVFTYNVDAMVEEGLLAEGERVANDWTWEQFKTYAEALKEYDEDGVTLKQVGMGLALNWPNGYSPFIYAYGGDWADKVNKKVTLSNEKVEQGIQEAISAIENRWLYPEGITLGGELASSYGSVSTRNGCVFAYNQAYTVLTSNADPYITRGVTWDVAPFPLFPEKASPCGTLGFGVFSYTKNKDAAAALVLSLWSEEGQIALHAQEGGDVPVLKKLGDQDFWHLTKEGYENINFSAFTANYEKYVPGQVNASVPPEIASIIEKGIPAMFNAYCTNDASWTDKLQEMETQCNELWSTLYSD
ncbi:MAG: extracellular solute-binding protein [Clostridia bacterium]|nr:extracellular solute-binding protein [Clostridia bacterium]